MDYQKRLSVIWGIVEQAAKEQKSTDRIVRLGPIEHKRIRDAYSVFYCADKEPAQADFAAVYQMIERADRRTEGNSLDLTEGEVEIVRMLAGKEAPAPREVVLKCYISGRSVHAWCPCCNKWHVHGFDEDITPAMIVSRRRLGDWVAHCHDDDAFGNYSLSLFTRKEIEAIRESLGQYPETKQGTGGR